MAEGEDQPISCPICSCPYADLVAVKTVGGRMFRVMQCCNVDCLHGFLTPLPTLEFLESMYSNENLNEYLAEETTIKRHSQHYSHLFEVYVPMAFSKPGTLLDLGAGVGTFVWVARKFGWQATGIEFNERSVLWAKRKFDLQIAHGSFYQLESCYSHESFDLITLNHVLEHVIDPISFIEYLTSFLKLNGGIMLSVPNILSDSFRKYRALWSYIHIPMHISYFSRFSMNALFLSKVHLRGRRFEKVFQTSFPPQGQDEGEGLTSMYRLVVD